MAGVRPRRPAYPALRLATALATVAFLLVSGVDVLTRGLSRMALGAAAPAPPVEAPMLGAAPANEGLAEGEQPPQERALASELPPTPPALQAFADALAGTPTAAEEGLPPVYGGGEPPEASPAGTLVGIGGGGPLPTMAAGLALSPSKTSTPTPTPTPSPTPTATPTPVPQLTIVAVEIPEAGGPPGLGPLRWAEILLGAAVVVFAVFSLWFRREA
jgi:hypothetical protein